MSKNRIFSLLIVIALFVGFLPTFTTFADSEPPTQPIYLDKSYSFAERAADLVARMTPSQRASQLRSQSAPAIPELGVSLYEWWGEALHGYLKGTVNGMEMSHFSNTYPQSLAVGSSWDPDLYYEESVQISDEIRERTNQHRLNLNMYSPTINMQRDPRWGRNEESYSEDPFLVAAMGTQFSNGLEGKDKNGNLLDPNGYYKTTTTIKHYTANNHENGRGNSGATIDERALREYYLAPYREVLKQTNASSLMTAYSSLNGIPMTIDTRLNDTILRQTWGFDGFITTDCGAIGQLSNYNYINPYTGVKLTTPEQYAFSLAAGIDLECNSSGSSFGAQFATIIAGNTMTDKGIATENMFDVNAHRLMTARMKLGEFDGDISYVTAAEARVNSQKARVATITDPDPTRESQLKQVYWQTPERLELNQKVAEASIVMLKNDLSERKDGSTAKLLPLQIPTSGSFKVAIIGQWATNNFLGIYTSYQTVQPNMVRPQQGITNAIKAINPDAEITYYKGFTNTQTALASLTTVDPAAITAAAAADLCIVYTGTEEANSREGTDRTTIALPGAQASLISQVGKANKNTIAIMESCGPMQVSTFESDVSAILWSSFLGFYKGTAIGNVLTGKVNPSGKLTTTWYTSVADSGASDIPGIREYSLYKSDTLAGRTYMYYDGPYSYPFGHGLSYTTFGYSNLTLSATEVDANGSFNVSVDVTNTGSVKGKEVVQLYVATPDAPAELKRPIKRLKGFDKVELEPGETKTVNFTIKVPDLEFFNELTKRFEVDAGRYQIQAGGSSKSFITKDITVTGALKPTVNVVTAKPVQDGDPALDIGERLIFSKGRTVIPQLTVAMNDETLYGYIIKGKSVDMPAGMTVTYTSNRPSVVSVDGSGVIRTVGSGVATITATVSYEGKSASGEFIVYVKANDSYPDAITVNGTPIKNYNKDTVLYSVAIPYDTNTVPTVGATSGNPNTQITVTQATTIPGVATVTVRDESGGLTQVYKVCFGRPPKPVDLKTVTELPAEWTIVNPVPENMSFSSGGLLIKSERGDLRSIDNPPKNLCLQPAAGDWVVQTHVTLASSPTTANQQYGFIVYDDNLNYLKFVYERPATGGSTPGSATSNAFRVYNISNGGIQQLNGTNSANQTNLYFQIGKVGNTYTFKYSTNGTSWTTFGTSANLPYTNPKIGLLSSNGDPATLSPASINATFEYLNAYDPADLSPTVNSITLDGVPLGGFDPSTLNYTIFMDDFNAAIPQVAATSAKYNVTVTQASALPGYASIIVSSPVASVQYSVTFSAKPTSSSFVSGTMDDKWKILNPDPAAYSIQKGLGLRLPTQNVDIYTSGRNWKNLFIRPAAGEDWEAVAKVFYPKIPDTNYQQIMFLAFQDEDNYVKIDCERSNLTVQSAYERNGSVTSVATTTTTANPGGANLTLYFKIKKFGNIYQCSYSKDGITFTNLGSQITFDLKNPQLGIFASKNSTSGNVMDIYCEYVDIVYIDSVIIKSPDQMLKDAFDKVVEYVFDDIPTVAYSDIAFSLVPYGYTVSAVSSDPDTISNTGVVTRGSVDKTVTLDVTVTDGVRTNTKAVTVTVPKPSNVVVNSVNCVNIVSGYAANVAVKVTGENLDACDVSMFGKTSKLVKANGYYAAYFNFAASEIPAAGSYTVKVLDKGETVGSTSINVSAKDYSIWTLGLSSAEGKLTLNFNADVALAPSSVVKVNNVAKGITGTTARVVTTDVDYASVVPGTVVSVSGVKLTTLFPGYTFTFSATA